MSWLSTAAQLLTQFLYVQSALAGLTGRHMPPAAGPGALALPGGTNLSAGAHLQGLPFGPPHALETTPAIFAPPRARRLRGNRRHRTAAPATTTTTTTTTTTATATATATAAPRRARPTLSPLCTTVEEGARAYYALHDAQRRQPGAAAEADRAYFPLHFHLIHAACSHDRAQLEARDRSGPPQEDPVQAFHARIASFDARVEAIDTFFARLAEVRTQLSDFIDRQAPRQLQPALRQQAQEAVDRQVERAGCGLSYGAMPPDTFHPDLAELQEPLRQRIETQSREGLARTEAFYAAGPDILGTRENGLAPVMAHMQDFARNGVLSFRGGKALDDLLEHAPRAHRPANATSRGGWLYLPQAMADAGTSGRTAVTRLRHEMHDPAARTQHTRYRDVELRGDAYRLDHGDWRPNPFPTDAAREAAKHRAVQALMDRVARRAFDLMYRDQHYDRQGLRQEGWFWQLLARFGPFSQAGSDDEQG
ncbi:hypothetical protein GT347_12040 [Xylophilus rhododendri]|uniref:Uncharacterized protein n=1 Tax=Xylophilus rhododendri TaxID=2697032 RepID=A0A857J6E3_9BURK|nr:hypothetical protein [Xylophilus rhododendri]QHI98659.1 hypothetical protein GT347_12040 [Xylophilus rhododendri]